MKHIILAEREKYTERDSDIVFMLYAGGQIFCICDYEENNHKIEYKKFSSFNEAWNYFSAECEDRDFPKRPQDKSGERMAKALELYEKYTAEDWGEKPYENLKLVEPNSVGLRYVGDDK